MADAEASLDSATSRRRLWPRERRWQYLLIVLILVLVSSLLSWRAREEIAADLISSQLKQLGLEASYEIESITPTRQVLRNFVIGDPAHPDLAIERVEVAPVLRLTGPGIGTVKLVRPRLRASYHDGKLSLGALDPLLQMESEDPAGLPDWTLEIIDGRARMLSDYGAVGAKFEGSGPLSGGFRGLLALSAPELDVEGCSVSAASISGRVSVTGRKPGFSGPLRIDRLECAEAGIQLAALEIATDIEGDRDLAGLSGEARIATGGISAAGVASKGLSGTVEFDWNDGLANSRYRLTSETIASTGFTFAALSAQGGLRFRPQDARLELDAGIEGRELGLDVGFAQTIDDWRVAAQGSLAEPLLARFGKALHAALPGASLTGELTFRRSSEGQSLVIPSAGLRASDGTSLFALSQGQLGLELGQDGATAVRIAGNFAGGGEGLPQFRGRMEQAGKGLPALRLSLAPYSAEGSSLAIPDLLLSQRGKGNWRINGRIEASGPVPGGNVQQLDLPLEGRWSARNGLALWSQCAEVGFARLELSGLDLEPSRIELCPEASGPILRSGVQGIEIAARAKDIALTGSLGEQAAKIEIGEVQLSVQDGAIARDVQIALGSGEEQSLFALASLGVGFTDGARGTFEGLEARLAAVPLDILDARGEWEFADGVLNAREASFGLHDRSEAARFYPLHARGGSLRFAGNVISAEARLRNPASDRVVADITLRHDLADASGYADLSVPALRFDEGLQPDELTVLADGVIALVEGTITGAGRIDWSSDQITSTGEFSSDKFDFAAAFGPVERVSGTVRFSDLLSLTTDGTQSLAIGSINPGVEVFDGVLEFALRDLTLVSIKQGRWPFFGGVMVLRPTELNLALSEERNYVIEITGVDAAQFIAAMEMGNISATGTFDGAVPLVFDEMGNGEILNGLLISRAPGGNLSYVGELTYEDTGAIANFAFQSLRSLDFSQMMVEMNGPLTGEIVTRLLFDGVRQGEGASSNFMTRQIARLPIRFNVNIRAAFYELLTSLRGMYDPAFVRDPRSVGLLTTESGQFVRPEPPEQNAVLPRDNAGDEPPIQPQESESLP